MVDGNFTWTEEETALLKEVAANYKVAKCFHGLDWETIRNRYEGLFKRLQGNYSNDLTEGFQNICINKL